MRAAGLACVALFVSFGSLAGEARDPFAQPLSRDKQPVHVLNRMAYGPHPGQVDEVKRLGVDAWIRVQLDPTHLPESSILQQKLHPLTTLAMPSWLAFEKHQGPPPRAPAPLARLLPADDVAILQSGSPEQRSAVLMALTGEKRTQILLAAPAAAMAGLLDVQTEAFNLRAAEAERQRRLRPTLSDLLTMPQLMTLFNGADAEKNVLLRGLDPEKRNHVLRLAAPLSMPPDFRRQALALNQGGQLPLVELIDAKIYRAVYSTHQLEEVLVDFWLNHFNVFAGKGPVRMFLPSYERDAIRPHVLGRFRDMLLATARHPAMLFYLDNWQSQAPRTGRVAAAEDGAPSGLNENYGRELLELHTLGVDGGYTQSDVVNVARAFTGWTIYEPNQQGEFFFNPGMHDRGEKVILGHTLPRGGGEEDGVAVVNMLSRHPSTARFIAHKVVQRFVADEPPKSVVDRAAAVFISSDGDLRAVTESVLRSKEFLSEGAWRSKVKSPVEFAFSALRASNAEVADPFVLARRIADMGQPLYGKAEPTGYPNNSQVWGSGGNLLTRMNFATAMISGQIDGVAVDTSGLPNSMRALARALIGFEAPPPTLDALDRVHRSAATGRDRVAVVFASPDFQKR